MRKLKVKKARLLICVIIIIAVIILCVFGLKKTSKSTNKFVGEWTTDGVTVYKFNEDNTGALILPLSEYKFSYKLEEDKLYVDFIDEKSEDSDYTYVFKDDKLILTGKNGKFIFKKKEVKE